jgi:SulP family sulfate permease
VTAVADQLPRWPVRLRQEWFSNIRADLLSGILVALALIPEAIGFSIIAGVDPKVGLYASVCIAIVSAIVGGRPGLISAATGAMAVVMVTLVRDYGLQYLFAATLLTGVLQIIAGWLRLGLVMRYIPRSVMIGFVNALALLIFSAQLPQFAGASWQMYAMVAAGLAIIYLFPRLTKAVPSPLVAILILSTIAIVLRSDVRTVGQLGDLPTTLPFFAVPQVPYTFETLRIIFPYAITLAMVGLIESWLTASLVDEVTDTPSDKNVEARGQGLANIASGFFGGMAGCAMIGQTMINIKSGGRGRLSTFTAGAFLLFLLIILGDLVGRIPVGALVAVMIMVCIGTFDWNSLRTIHRVPRGEAVVMLATVGTVLLTRDLSRGVLVGVVVKAIIFAHKIAMLLKVESELSADGFQRTYRVSGQMFFASVQDFRAAFDFREPIERVVIDLTGVHIWDGSAVAALDKVVLKYRAQGVSVDVIGLNEASTRLVEQLGIYHRADAATGLPVGGAH